MKEREGKCGVYKQECFDYYKFAILLKRVASVLKQEARVSQNENPRMAISQTREWNLRPGKNVNVAFNRKDKTHDDLIGVDLMDIKCRKETNLCIKDQIYIW